MFLDTLAAITVDHRHDAAEQRSVTNGRTKADKVLSTGHSDDGIEIFSISARIATLMERRQYENG